MHPLVSIIVPAYNASKYLSKCIDSIIEQTAQSYEVIIVDDGSTDETAVICDAYEQNNENIKVIHKKNAGVSAARNEALGIASGTWVTFVDSDDSIGKTFIEQIKDADEVDLIVSNYFSVINASEHKNSYPRISTDIRKTKEIINKYINKEIFQAPWSKFFRLSIIKDHKIMFDTNLAFAEDMIFNLEYLKHTRKIFFTNEGDYIYICPNNLLGELKYKINIPQLITLSDKFYELSTALNLNNKQFQSSYIYLWTVMEEYCLRNSCFVEKERKGFYKTKYQALFSKDYLSTRSLIYRLMYHYCRLTPHWLNKIFVKSWLNLVYKRNII